MKSPKLFVYLGSIICTLALTVLAQDQTEKKEAASAPVEQVEESPDPNQAKEETPEKNKDVDNKEETKKADPNNDETTKEDVEKKETKEDADAKKAAEEKAKKKIAEIKQKAEEAKKVEAMKRARLVTSSSGYGSTTSTKSDPNDSVERLLIFTPGTPLIIETEIQVEGKGFRELWNSLFQKMMEQADTDNDGKATWEEALSNPRFAHGRFARQTMNEATKKRYIDSYDRNNNKLVDLNELAMIMGASSFSLNARSYQQNVADIVAILDENKSKSLTEEELKKAESLLKKFDTNDNDLVEQRELTNRGTQRDGRQIFVARTTNQSTNALLLNAGGTTPEVIFGQLKEKYGDGSGKLNADCFPLMKSLFETLDENKNGTLEAKECAKFNTIPPHLKLQANFGPIGKNKVEMKLLSVDPVLGKQEEIIKKEKTKLTLKITAATIEFDLQDMSRTYDYSAQGKSILSRFDANKDGLLEEKELKGQSATYYKQMFKVWDADGNNKVSPDEITKWYNDQQMPRQNRMYASAMTMGRELFSIIDETKDNRISLREMKNAGERLKKLDTNQDGEITLEEIPVKLHVGLGRGGYNNSSRARRVPFANKNNQDKSKNDKDLEWFHRMDRNGDGDITLREWLGTTDQFDKLDTNQDTFIESAEAKAAKIQTAKTEPANEDPANEDADKLEKESE